MLLRCVFVVGIWALCPSIGHAEVDLPSGSTEVISIRPSTQSGPNQAVAVETITPMADSKRVVRAVTRPTLTVFLPLPATRTGVSVVICPGGGFESLAIDTEGFDVARRFQTIGIAAFVLKYRLGEASSIGVGSPARSAPLLERVVADAADDGREAIRVVRRRAAAWSLDPHRIGIVGFSAGGQVANSVASRYEADTRPDFAASLYGVPSKDAAPRDAPPLFLAVAADDRQATVGWNLALFRQWRSAGRSAELHVFASGGHGFADASTKDTSAGLWFPELLQWLRNERVLGLPD